MNKCTQERKNKIWNWQKKDQTLVRIFMRSMRGKDKEKMEKYIHMNFNINSNGQRIVRSITMCKH